MKWFCGDGIGGRAKWKRDRRDETKQRSIRSDFRDLVGEVGEKPRKFAELRRTTKPGFVAPVTKGTTRAYSRCGCAFRTRDTATKSCGDDADAGDGTMVLRGNTSL